MEWEGRGGGRRDRSRERARRSTIILSCCVRRRQLITSERDVAPLPQCRLCWGSSSSSSRWFRAQAQTANPEGGGGSLEYDVLLVGQVCGVFVSLSRFVVR